MGSREDPTIEEQGVAHIHRVRDDSPLQRRSETIKVLEGDIKSFLFSRTPDSDHPGPRCVSDRCTRPRVAGVGDGSILPRYCRLHLTIFFAQEIAPTMKGDPEQFTSEASMGLLYILIHERMLGGPEAIEAHRALEEYCAPLLDWEPEKN